MTVYTNIWNPTNAPASTYNPFVRAAANFAGASGALAAAFNVTSVTRNGAGDYTVNFTNALSDDDYFVSVSAGQASRIVTYSNKQAASVDIASQTITLGLFGNSDATEISVLIYRGQP